MLLSQSTPIKPGTDAICRRISNLNMTRWEQYKWLFQLILIVLQHESHLHVSMLMILFSLYSIVVMESTWSHSGRHVAYNIERSFQVWLMECKSNHLQNQMNWNILIKWVQNTFGKNYIIFCVSILNQYSWHAWYGPSFNRNCYFKCLNCPNMALI